MRDETSAVRTLPRLYAILDLDLTATRGLDPVELAELWLDCGVRLFQLRAKSAASGLMLDLATRLQARAGDAGATFVVNDRADIAHLCGATAVHVGQDDLRPDAVRRIAPGLAMVGLSTHNDDQVAAALETSASYIAIGPVFSTSTKANPDPVVGLAGVARAARVTAAAGRPLVAIGGITLETAADVLAAGADAIAVTSDLLRGVPRVRVERYLLALA